MLQLLSCKGWKPTGQQYHDAANHNQIHILRWLHHQQIPAIDYLTPACSEEMVLSTSALLALGDIGAYLSPGQQLQLVQARKACCTFYGLLRWCCRAIPAGSKDISHASSRHSPDALGWHLLVTMSRLPVEVVDRIALAAGMRHNLFQLSDADDHLYPQLSQT